MVGDTCNLQVVDFVVWKALRVTKLIEARKYKIKFLKTKYGHLRNLKVGVHLFNVSFFHHYFFFFSFLFSKANIIIIFTNQPPSKIDNNCQ